MSEVFTVKQLAEYLQVTPQSIYNLLTDENIPGFKVGRRWRFKKDDIDKWIYEKKIKPESE